LKSNLTPFLFLAVAGAAQALDTPQWPPPAAEAQRMRELQQVIASRNPRASSATPRAPSWAA
jgi:hypothetical protein